MHCKLTSLTTEKSDFDTANGSFPSIKIAGEILVCVCVCESSFYVGFDFDRFCSFLKVRCHDIDNMFKSQKCQPRLYVKLHTSTCRCKLRSGPFKKPNSRCVERSSLSEAIRLCDVI